MDRRVKYEEMEKKKGLNERWRKWREEMKFI